MRSRSSMSAPVSKINQHSEFDSDLEPVLNILYLIQCIFIFGQETVLLNIRSYYEYNCIQLELESFEAESTEQCKRRNADEVSSRPSLPCALVSSELSCGYRHSAENWAAVSVKCPVYRSSNWGLATSHSRHLRIWAYCYRIIYLVSFRTKLTFTYGYTVLVLGLRGKSETVS